MIDVDHREIMFKKLNCLKSVFKPSSPGRFSRSKNNDFAQYFINVNALY